MKVPSTKTTGAPRASRGAPRASQLILILAAVVAGASIVAVVSSKGGDARPQPASSIQAPTLCDTKPVREQCNVIRVGGYDYRYALLRTVKQTEETVILDFGGPGTAVLSGASGIGNFATSNPAISGRYNILVLEEPWVTREVDPGCDAALSEYYTVLRDSGGRTTDRHATDDVDRKCDFSSGTTPWGFTATSYPKLVAAVLSHNGLSLSGFVAHSWGSARLSYLAATRPKWAILDRPYPVGAKMTDVVAASAASAASFAATQTQQVQMPKLDRARSVPVTTFDKVTAIAELGYVEDEIVTNVAPGVVAGTDTERIGLLSDQFWGRYGTMQMSPRILSYLTEVCPFVGRWDMTYPTTLVGDLEAILGSMYLPCGAGTTAWQPIRGDIRTCVIVSPRDPVSPGSLVRAAFAHGDSVTWIEAPSRAHVTFDQLDTCAQNLRI